MAAMAVLKQQYITQSLRDPGDWPRGFCIWTGSNLIPLIAAKDTDQLVL